MAKLIHFEDIDDSDSEFVVIVNDDDADLSEYLEAGKVIREVAISEDVSSFPCERILRDESANGRFLG